MRWRVLDGRRPTFCVEYRVGGSCDSNGSLIDRKPALWRAGNLGLPLASTMIWRSNRVLKTPDGLQTPMRRGTRLSGGEASASVGRLCSRQERGFDTRRRVSGAGGRSSKYMPSLAQIVGDATLLA